MVDRYRLVFIKHTKHLLPSHLVSWKLENTICCVWIIRKIWYAYAACLFISRRTAQLIISKSVFICRNQFDANCSFKTMMQEHVFTKWLIIPPNEVVWGGGGYTCFTPSVCPSVRPSRMPCPLCNIYSSGWILSILGTNDHYHERVCRAPWPLTLTYIFKVIRPWLRKSCPLCSVNSSGKILFIFGTNDHYH